MNLCIFVVLNMELVSGEAWFWNLPLMTFNQDKTSIFECREDQAAINFLKQVITDFILKIVVGSVMALVKKILAKIRGVSHWKDEYELS